MGNFVLWNRFAVSNLSYYSWSIARLNFDFDDLPDVKKCLYSGTDDIGEKD